ncbi:MAG: hypothetical protein ABH851_06370, partial [Methanobacteriota archaeon]
TVQVNEVIDEIYDKFPVDIRDRIEQRKSVARTPTEVISEDDETWLKAHIEELFKKGGGGSEKPS